MQVEVGFALIVRQDSRDLARVLVVVDRRAGKDADIGIEIVVGLGAVFEIIAVADRLPADIALERDPLGVVDDIPAGIQFVDRGILDDRAGRHLAGHMEVDRVVAELAALAEIDKLDALDLDLLEPLAKYRMPAEVIAALCLPVGAKRPVRRLLVGFHVRIWRLDDPVALRDDADAARQQRHRGARFCPFRDQVLIHPGGFETGFRRPEIDLVALAAVEPFDRRGEGDVIPLHLADGQQLGMAGQVVGRGDDDLVAGPVARQPPPFGRRACRPSATCRS